jgi:hypothetical protein
MVGPAKYTRFCLGRASSHSGVPGRTPEEGGRACPRTARLPSPGLSAADSVFEGGHGGGPWLWASASRSRHALIRRERHPLLARPSRRIRKGTACARRTSLPLIDLRRSLGMGNGGVDARCRHGRRFRYANTDGTVCQKHDILVTLYPRTREKPERHEVCNERGTRLRPGAQPASLAGIVTTFFPVNPAGFFLGQPSRVTRGGLSSVGHNVFWSKGYGGEARTPRAAGSPGGTAAERLRETRPGPDVLRGATRGLRLAGWSGCSEAVQPCDPVTGAPSSSNLQKSLWQTRAGAP